MRRAILQQFINTTAADMEALRGKYLNILTAGYLNYSWIKIL